MKKKSFVLKSLFFVLLLTSCSKVTDYIFPVVDEQVSHSILPVILYDNPYLTTDSPVLISRPEGGVVPDAMVIPLEKNGLQSVDLKQGQALFLLRINTGTGKVQPSKTGTVSLVDKMGTDVSRSALVSADYYGNSALNYNYSRYGTGFMMSGDSSGGNLFRQIMEFNENPPVLAGRNVTGAEQEKIYLKDGCSGDIVGDKGSFWVQNVVTNKPFYQEQATLKAVGEYCKIWVADNVFGDGSSGSYTISDSRVKELQEKFDSIYALQTKILGYEYGGGPGGNGGRDGEKKVLILIYDFGNTNAESGYVGFFWGKDYYPQSVLDSSGNSDLRTNYAEIFYIDSKFSAAKPELVESTLSHEFLHMISFNNVIKNNKASPTWYDEMMAMMTEDVMSYKLETLVKDESSAYVFKTAHPFFRFCDYLTVYPFSGLDMWHEDGFISYANSYGFGSYLLRRFGGSRILSSLIKSGEVGIPSIQKAVSGIQGNLAFEQLYRDYALSFLATGNSSTPENYFGKSYEEYFSENENPDAVVAGYYPWKTPNQDWKNATATSDYPFCNKICGPSIFDLNGFVMSPNSFSLHTDYDWGGEVFFRVKKGSKVVSDEKYYLTFEEAKKDLKTDEKLYYFISGVREDTTLNLDVKLPADSNVKMYLIAR